MVEELDSSVTAIKAGGPVLEFGYLVVRPGGVGDAEAEIGIISMARAAGEGQSLWCGKLGEKPARKVLEWYSELKGVCVCQNWGEWEYWEGRAGVGGNPQGQRGVLGGFLSSLGTFALSSNNTT